jgi:hypothetical protein
VSKKKGKKKDPDRAVDPIIIDDGGSIRIRLGSGGTMDGLMDLHAVELPGAYTGVRVIFLNLAATPPAWKAADNATISGKTVAIATGGTTLTFTIGATSASMQLTTPGGHVEAKSISGNRRYLIPNTNPAIDSVTVNGSVLFSQDDTPSSAVFVRVV